jgi:NAD(P)-dependent dehydrogenase (short-subunit alcohol dehydrogenase family)
MTTIPYRTALIVGAGPGISASLARQLAAFDVKVGLAARNIEKLRALSAETLATTFAVDASDASTVAQLFDQVDQRLGEPDLVVYNASARAHGPIAEIDPAAVQKAIAITAFGGFLVTQQAAKRMVPRGRGAILLTGATASVKGVALSSAFAMGKFALRGLAQSAARELGPRAFTSRISLLMAVCAARDVPTLQTSLTALSIRTPSPRPISTCCASIEAHGRSRSRSGRLSSASDHRAQP